MADEFPARNSYTISDVVEKSFFYGKNQWKLSLKFAKVLVYWHDKILNKTDFISTVVLSLNKRQRLVQNHRPIEWKTNANLKNFVKFFRPNHCIHYQEKLFW